MDQVKIQVVELELGKGVVELGGDRLRGVGVGDPEFGGNEEVVSGDGPGAEELGEGATDGGLVVVDGGAVQVAVTRGDGAAHGVVDLGLGGFPGPEAERRDGGAGVQTKGGKGWWRTVWMRCTQSVTRRDAQHSERKRDRGING